ncbi:hypothetical protein WJX77_005137 [Trebouxia sp. C0004]
MVKRPLRKDPKRGLCAPKSLQIWSPNTWAKKANLCCVCWLLLSRIEGCCSRIRPIEGETRIILANALMPSLLLYS